MPIAILTPTNCMAQARQANTIACPLDSTAKAIYKGETSMAYTLFEQVDKLHDKNENIVISPLCLADALSILANGAKGITSDQIMSVLGTEDLEAGKLSEVYGKLNDYLAGFARENGIKNVHSVWIDNKFKLKNEYTAKNRNDFKAEIRNHILASDMTKNNINLWCSQNTRGSIKNILSQPLSSDAKIALFNIVCFNGTWNNVFEEDVTRPMDFQNADGTKSKVMMMQQEEHYQVYEGDKMDLLRIPYLKGNFYMEIYLPHKGENLEDCMRNFSKKQDTQMRKRTSDQKVALDMPRLDLKCENNFIEPLKAMEMTDAFSSEADFSGIADNSPSVSDIRQIISLKFAEKGTDAVPTSRKPFNSEEMTVKPFFFTMNRPFFFTIREHKSGTILFMGKVRKL
jgi:serpin B